MNALVPTLADAREKLEAWRRYYNEDRPHGAIGHKPPISLQNPGDAASPSEDGPETLPSVAPTLGFGPTFPRSPIQTEETSGGNVRPYSSIQKTLCSLQPTGVIDNAGNCGSICPHFAPQTMTDGAAIGQVQSEEPTHSKNRNGWWHDRRRVPDDVATEVGDHRRSALKTKDVIEARKRRDKYDVDLERRWQRIRTEPSVNVRRLSLTMKKPGHTPSTRQPRRTPTCSASLYRDEVDDLAARRAVGPSPTT